MNLLFGRKGADMRLGKFLFRFIITIIILVIIAAGVLIWYIAPDRKLNLNYTDLNIQDKAMQMLKTKKPEITLNNEELNELAKKELIKHMGDMPRRLPLPEPSSSSMGRRLRRILTASGSLFLLVLS